VGGGLTNGSPGKEAGVSAGGFAGAVAPFASVLEERGLDLRRGTTRALQVNTGFLCNLACRHCHLEAGLERREVMSRETMADVVSFARRHAFETADITGGAPEMVPGVEFLVEGLASAVPRLLFRTNLLALAERAPRGFLELCAARRVVLVASLPSTHPAQTDAQRGAGTALAAVAVLRRLNAMGYGVEGSGLELDLAVNPVGAFLPPSQAEAEARFRRDLRRKWGISFSRLYTFANVPLGRFGRWLLQSGNRDRYMRTLAERFNPRAIEGLMCRSQISVGWDGLLYDCDFNLAAGLPLAGRRTHLRELDGPPAPGSPVAVGDHCYACTAGAGFTCGGAIAGA